MPYHVILTASNPKNDLNFLKKEFQNLQASFNKVIDVVTPVINLNAKEESVFNAFLSEADIRLFHFSGHAGDGKFLMDDGQFARANIMAGMIRYIRNIKVVFLNGCATYELVDKFLEYGARLVIATSAPVFDSVACDFSSSFYEYLCNGETVGKAFDKAKRDVTKNIEQTKADLTGDKNPDIQEYLTMLNEFEGMPVARSIRKIKKTSVEKKDEASAEKFKWSMYFSSDLTDEERKEFEGWRLKIGGLENSPVMHPEHGFDFLTSLAKAALSVKADVPVTDSRFAHFRKIEAIIENVRYWGNQETTDMIIELEKLMFLPLNKPFRALMNHCNTRGFDNNDADNLKQLLTFQVDLYKAFVRTAAAIMISDFLESLVLIQVKEEDLNKKKELAKNSPEDESAITDALADFEEAKKMLCESIRSNPQFSSDLQDLISGSKNLKEITFTIGIMRNISSCLASARLKASDKNKQVFSQFVKEYNVSGTAFEIASMNLIHQIFIAFDKKIGNGDIDQAPAKTLRSYCDKAEEALIQLFEAHKYVLLYEIITVGKVEAVRPRKKMPRTIRHELITHALLTPTETDYGKEFAENYSVVLVSNRKDFTKYLSLSPFIINVAPFMDEDTSMLFYFNGKAQTLIEYVELDEKKDPDLKINLAANIGEKSFLEMNKTVSLIYNRRDGKYKSLARDRFFNVRVQYQYAEERILGLIKQAV